MNFTMGGAVAPSFSERLDFAIAVGLGPSTSTVATTGRSPLVLSTVSLKAMQDLLRDLPREPFADFMDKQGMPPEDGYVLILPEHLRPHLYPPPRYVRFSPLGGQPLIVLDPTRLDFDPL